MDGTDYYARGLGHSGVKGMRWGRRKGTPTASVPASVDSKASTKQRSRIQKGNTDPLSNKQLKTVISRMSLEKQYRELAGASVQKTRGQKFVSALLKDGSNVGRQQANQAANKYAAQQIAVLLAKKTVGA